MDNIGGTSLATSDLLISWPSFVLGFSVGAMVFTVAFSVIFLYYRYIMNKTGGFSLKDEVA